ncbi:hypothetical protein GQ53DRAFT_201295 [Thozetella sp. PMI_491]|nr:hypothetical protein GQ53DRAFT_201295 [Thozetella sp. PMI_491]
MGLRLGMHNNMYGCWAMRRHKRGAREERRQKKYTRRGGVVDAAEGGGRDWQSSYRMKNPPVQQLMSRDGAGSKVETEPRLDQRLQYFFWPQPASLAEGHEGREGKGVFGLYPCSVCYRLKESGGLRSTLGVGIETLAENGIRDEEGEKNEIDYLLLNHNPIASDNFPCKVDAVTNKPRPQFRSTFGQLLAQVGVGSGHKTKLRIPPLYARLFPACPYPRNH